MHEHGKSNEEGLSLTAENGRARAGGNGIKIVWNWGRLDMRGGVKERRVESKNGRNKSAMAAGQKGRAFFV